MAKKKTEKPETGVVVIQPELMQVTKSVSMNKTEAEKIASGYAPFMIRISELSEALKTIDKDNPTDEDVKIARMNRLLMVKVRTEGIDVQKKADKEESLIRTKLVDSLVKIVQTSAELTELEYLKIEKFHERRVKEAEEKLRSSRTLLLSEYGTDVSYIPLGQLTEEQFTALQERERLAHEQRAINLKIQQEKEEEERLKQIELDKTLEAERQRLLKSQEDAEKERLRLKAIQDKKDAKLQARIEALVKTGASFTGVNFFHDTEDPFMTREELETLNEADFNDLLESAQLIQGAIKEEAERKEAELEALRQKQKEKEALDLAEAERVRAAAIAPDKDKINDLYVRLKDFSVPECETEEAKKIVTLVSESILIILAEIKREAKQLKQK